MLVTVASIRCHVDYYYVFLLVHYLVFFFFFFFFFNDTATTEIYTLSLHDALPICQDLHGPVHLLRTMPSMAVTACARYSSRSEEHTSELQSLAYLVCRLLLEKKKYKSPLLLPP